MSRVMLDSQTIEQLVAPSQPVDVCDKSGRVVGVFTPQIDSGAFDREPNITEEELRRRMKEKGGRSLTEILSDLENRS